MLKKKKSENFYVCLLHLLCHYYTALILIMHNIIVLNNNNYIPLFNKSSSAHIHALALMTPESSQLTAHCANRRAPQDCALKSWGKGGKRKQVEHNHYTRSLGFPPQRENTICTEDSGIQQREMSLESHTHVVSLAAVSL